MQGTGGFSEEQVMLTLSLLSYRGFINREGGWLSDAKLRTIIEASLDRVSPVKRQWELVWGPSTFRTPGTLFADSCMFIVRNEKEPWKYTIVIRGTNPISVFDWLFGDFWVGYQADWPYGDPSGSEDARISYSMKLGLTVMRHLRSTTPRQDPLFLALRRAQRRLGDAVGWLDEEIIDPIEARVIELLLGHRVTLRDGAIVISERVRTWPVPDLFRELAAALRAGWIEFAQFNLQHLLFHLFDKWPEETHRRILDRFESSVVRRSYLTPGVDVRTYLRAASEEAKREGLPPLEVTVTGHSKGGALAPIFALWLADTKTDESEEEGPAWSPEGDALVRSYFFAGPTPGNDGFARRFEHVLGEHSFRIVNPLDIVTNVWAVDSPADPQELHLGRIPRIYEPAVPPDSGRDQIFEKVIGELCQKVDGFKYRHVGKHVHSLEGALDPRRPLLLEQVIYQHLDGYILGLDLQGTLDLLDIGGVK